MGWIERPFVALDCETTGVDCFTDRIVQLAVATVEPDGAVSDGWVTIVDPGGPIPDDAATVHGITTERAQAEGLTPAAALAGLAERLYRVDIARTPVVMFNARYDWPLVLTEADRHGVDIPACVPLLDPYLLDRMLDRYRKGQRTLGATCAHYGVDLTDAHDALADAVAAARVMRALGVRHPALAARTLASLWLQQVRGHEDWRAGFVAWKRKQEPTFDIPAGWPIPVTAP